MKKTSRLAIVCDAPHQLEYRIAEHLVLPRISGTYDETAGMVVLGRQQVLRAPERHGRKPCSGLQELRHRT
jgi:hypothetical protein